MRPETLLRPMDAKQNPLLEKFDPWFELRLKSATRENRSGRANGHKSVRQLKSRHQRFPTDGIHMQRSARKANRNLRCTPMRQSPAPGSEIRQIRPAIHYASKNSRVGIALQAPSFAWVSAKA